MRNGEFKRPDHVINNSSNRVAYSTKIGTRKGQNLGNHIVLVTNVTKIRSTHLAKRIVLLHFIYEPGRITRKQFRRSKKTAK